MGDRADATVGRIASRWSQLIADNPDEPHAFAAQLGLHPSLVPGPPHEHHWSPPRPAPGGRAVESWHYDVTVGKRARAIRLGARPVPWRQLADIITRRNEAAR